jgi:hypothetical protein
MVLLSEVPVTERVAAMSFKFNDINHLALVCKDMDVTVDFSLGMKLVSLQVHIRADL